MRSNLEAGADPEALRRAALKATARLSDPDATLWDFLDAEIARWDVSDIPGWYAVRTRSRFEWKVLHGLKAASFETFLPTWIETVRWTDRTNQTIRPLFSGYVFVKFARFSQASRVLAIAGVIQILGRDELSAISDAEIENIRRVASLPVVPCPYVAVGTPITITSGPLTGVSGVVVKQKGSLRLIVSIEMLGQSCAVTLDAAGVKPEKK